MHVHVPPEAAHFLWEKRVVLGVVVLCCIVLLCLLSPVFTTMLVTNVLITVTLVMKVSLGMFSEVDGPKGQNMPPLGLSVGVCTM